MIYEFLVLGPAENIYAYRPGEVSYSKDIDSAEVVGSQPNKLCSKRLSILFTNRQCFYEASAIFYGKCTFRFLFGYHFIKHHRLALSKSVADRIQNLEIYWNGMAVTRDEKLMFTKDGSGRDHIMDPNVSRRKCLIAFRYHTWHLSAGMITIMKSFRKIRTVIVENHLTGLDGLWQLPSQLDALLAIQNLHSVLGPLKSSFFDRYMYLVSLEYRPAESFDLHPCYLMPESEAWEEFGRIVPVKE